MVDVCVALEDSCGVFKLGLWLQGSVNLTIAQITGAGAILFDFQEGCLMVILQFC